MTKVDRRQIIAFRLERSGLKRRTDDLRKAVGELGLPDFPPGAALAALAPRLTGAAPDTLARAFEKRDLTRMRAMRGAPVVVRREDVGLLAAGVRPPDERSLRAFLRPALASIDAANMSAEQAVDLVSAEASSALSRGPLDRDALHAALRRRLPKRLLPYCRPCNSHHVHPSLIYAVALAVPLLLFPQEKGPYLLTRADRWLKAKPRPPAHPGRELLRRFLRAYGPATVADFAAWAGLGGGQPQASWSSLEHELASVEVGGQRSPRWLLSSDIKALTAADPDRLHSSVRLLSPGDPLLQLRDRDLLVPDRKLQRVVWKNLSPTGVALVGADLAGITRMRKRGPSVEMTVETTTKLARTLRAAIEEQAAFAAKMREGTSVKVVWMG